MRTALGVLALLLVAAPLWVVSSCSARDCDEARAGQVRCVGNRVELCNADGTLSYESCSSQGLVCSEHHQACVTEQVAMTGSGGMGGAGGSGGATDTGGGG